MKRKIITVITALMLIMSVAVSSGWMMLGKEKLADVEQMLVDKPPTISIQNNETGTLDILNLSGLQVGKQKCIVFCVTPSNEGLVSNFILRLAYTENLMETIDLYKCVYSGTTEPVSDNNHYNADYMDELDRLPHSGDYVKVQSKDPLTPDVFHYYTVTSNPLSIYGTESRGDGYTAAELSSVSNENRVVYKTYRDTVDSEDFKFDKVVWKPENVWAGNEGRFLFYMLYIHWDSTFTDEQLMGLTAKETDIVYISAKGITGVTGGTV